MLFCQKAGKGTPYFLLHFLRKSSTLRAEASRCLLDKPGNDSNTEEREMKQPMKKLLPLALASSMVLGMATTAQAAFQDFTDVKGHWRKHPAAGL